ncbi:hypothetical protein MUP46_04630 [Patescibacteria group bacterium]|nr:hypothetical protein [Patescibacteria group bacterium]
MARTSYTLYYPDGHTETISVYELTQAQSIAKQRGASLTPIAGAPTPTPTPTTTTPTTTTPTTKAGVGIGQTSAEYRANLTKAYDQYLAFLQTPQGQGQPIPTSMADFQSRILGNHPWSYFDTLPTQTTPGGTTTPTADQASYDKYLAYIKTHQSWPTPKDINDYLAHRNLWEANGDFYDAGFNDTQIQNYNAFQGFASKYGNLNDWYPENIADYLENYDKAQQQLNTWRQEAGPEAAGFTDDQIREFNAFKDYASQYGKAGEWFPVDIGDFFANYDKAKGQLTTWQQQAGAVEEYELTPEEAARRREESYQRSQVAAGEAYHETPMYSETFAKEIQQWAGSMSGALRGFAENQFPSLRAKYEAGVGQMKGYSTPEEARAEAARRASGFEAWLPKQVPELKQQYYEQRPYARGERYQEQSPTLRAVNW